MRHLIQQLNEAAGRKYYVLVGMTEKGAAWEVIFGDYDRSAVEEEQADYRTHRGDPDLSYKKLRILTVPNAKQATIDAAVAALREDVEAVVDEAKKDRPAGHGRMIEYDWKKVAAAMGGTLQKTKDDRTRAVFIQKQNRTFEFFDNGGEVNISKREDVGASVPFWSTAHPGGSVGPLTLAYRLQSMIDGQAIDYEKDLDKE